MNERGKSAESSATFADALAEWECRAAGSVEPHYVQSGSVHVSLDEDLYVYHVTDDELGQGSSLGNAHCWCETKGNGDMLSMFSIDIGKQVFGGFSVTYLLPFSDISTEARIRRMRKDEPLTTFSRPSPTAPGAIHLHPAFQQREFIVGDGLHVLETFFVPRTGMDDPASAHVTVCLTNRKPHPISITVLGSVDMRGQTARDVTGRYDEQLGALLAWNQSTPDLVRVFGSSSPPEHYWLTADEEEAYNPAQDLPNAIDPPGDLTGSLQNDLHLLPGQSTRLRFTLAFSPVGQDAAIESFQRVRECSLKQTVEFHQQAISHSVVEMPDTLLTQAVQWAKTCMIRPLARYRLGISSTNDPGWSTHIVGRDAAWYVHGLDFVLPEISCEFLNILSDTQREDGLIVEYVDGMDGERVYHDFNINDNTPLFVMAVAHHVRTTGHRDCLERLYPAARKSGELILGQRESRGLVRCTNDGMGVRAICGWRNVLRDEQITGIVTEVNSECFAALKGLAYLAGELGHTADAARYDEAADDLRNSINKHLLNPRNGLYVRNIDLNEQVYTQATVDMVFPLICGVADDMTNLIVSERLTRPDFMSDAGIRALPQENPRYDPSTESGCLGGVWPGATWWFSMGCARTDPGLMASSLRRSYEHYVKAPRTFNTVPGQFSEWSDGQTLVNRGMRLSPWEAPRYLWAAIEGLAGVKFQEGKPFIEPQLPPDWQWLRVHNLRFRDGSLSYFLARQRDGIHIYTANDIRTGLHLHKCGEELREAGETLAIGLTQSAFRLDSEVLICLGNSRDCPVDGPFMTHHALDKGKHYRVSRLHAGGGDWEDLGVVDGRRLQQISVHIAALSCAIYSFIPAE